MIRNNLSILMSERGIKNSTLSMKTGISKNTISSTAQNDGKMIQLETVNKICQVLGTTPAEFFSYIPYDIDFQLSLNDIQIEFFSNDVYEVDKLFVKSIDLDLLFTVERSKNRIHEFLFETSDFSKNDILFNSNFFIDLKSTDDSFSSFWTDVPTTFKSDITTNVTREVVKEIRNGIITKIQEHEIINDIALISIVEELDIRVDSFHLELPY